MFATANSSPVKLIISLALFIMLAAVIYFPKGGEIEIFAPGTSVPTVVTLPPGAKVEVIDFDVPVSPKPPRCGDDINLFRLVMDELPAFARKNDLWILLERHGISRTSTVADFLELFKNDPNSHLWFIGLTKTVQAFFEVLKKACPEAD